MIKKLFTASAGTGKTYTLSLEYIATLLKHYGDKYFDFKNIVVITFTRKATAEIRDSIFERLQDIFDTSTEKAINKSQDIIRSLEKIVNKDLQTLKKQNPDRQIDDFELNDKYLSYLKDKYEEMLREKDKISISTIDSFISTIFKTLIAPRQGISNYDVQEINPPNIFERLFKELVTKSKDEDSTALARIMTRLNIRNKDDMVEYLDNLIRYRWLYGLTKDKLKPKVNKKEFDDAIKSVKSELRACLDKFDELLSNDKSKKEPLNVYLKKDLLEILKINSDIEMLHFKDKFLGVIDDEEFMSNYNNFNKLLKLFVFWDGRRIRGKNYSDLDKDKFANYTGDFGKGLNTIFQYLYLDKEQEEIYLFWGILLKHYDQIKLEEKVFTFDDLLWYTYSYMYEEDCSFYDKSKDMVTPEFYEALAMKVQYMFIDEFQDTSVMQFKVFAPILAEIQSGEGAHEQNGIIIVGDEKQSIYGWRGGEKSLLGSMRGFLGIESQDLNTCYRSYQNIVDFINKVFAEEGYQDLFKGGDQNWTYNDVSANNKKKDSLVTVEHFKYGSKGEGDKDASYVDFVQKFLDANIDKEDYNDTVIIARTNNQLVQIERFLLEQGVPFVRQSSSSLFDHDVVKSIMNFLNFLAYDDWKSFLALIRSNLFLQNADEIADIAGNVRNYYYKESEEKYTEFFDNALKSPYLKPVLDIRNKWQKFLKTNAPISLTELVNMIIEDLQIVQVFNSENELKNLYLFLQLIKEFDNMPSPYGRTLDGLLTKLSDLKIQQSKKQEGVIVDNAVQMMTIHKSKGLSFKHVFVYIDISTRAFPERSLFYYNFDQNYEIKDFRITNIYRSLTLKLDSELKEKVDAKENIEDMNNVYVALTRPVERLGVFIAETATNADKEDGNALINLRKNITDEDNKKEGHSETYTPDSYSANDKKKDDINFQFVGHDLLKSNREVVNIEVLDPDQLVILKEKIEQKTSDFFVKRAALRGNIAHSYLEHIYRNTDSERAFARQACLQEYANLLPVDDISPIIEACDRFLNKNTQYFNDDWDQIYNEYTVFKDEKMFRIDRMQISEKKKQILLIDFKTGGYDDEQLRNYKEIIEGLNVHGYQVETLYLEVGLD